MSIIGRLVTVSFFIFVLIVAGTVSPASAFDLSFVDPPHEPSVTLSGLTYVIKEQTPEAITVGVKVLCENIGVDETPPTLLNVDYVLYRDGLEVATQSYTADPVTWLLIIGEPASRVANITYEMPLPSTGIGSTELSSGTYYIDVRIMKKVVVTSTQSSDFSYTVFSGSLFFNAVEAHLQTLVTAGSCETNGVLLDLGSSGYWSSSYGGDSFGINGICAQPSASSDGYSVDLTTLSGSVSMPIALTGETGGLTWLTGGGVTLDATGGHTIGAVVTLPDTVSAHLETTDGELWPRGVREVSGYSAGSFTSSPDQLILQSTLAFSYHSYGLPFYVRSQGFSFSVDPAGSSGIVLDSPEPYYVHQQAFDALPSYNKRITHGFISNDAMFRGAEPSGSNSITISNTGMNGQLQFAANSCDTAFPKARLTHPSFTIPIEHGLPGPDAALEGTAPLSVSMTFSGNCPGTESCGESAPGIDYTVSLATGTFFNNGALGGRFDMLQQTDTPASSEVAWGALANGDHTFKRNDTLSRGFWLVPGFIMGGTATTPGSEGSQSIGQTLFGSFSFLEGTPLLADGVHPLHSLTDFAAERGDGFFAGITMGPEQLVGPFSGSAEIVADTGALLDNNSGLFLRFNGNTAFAQMVDRPATKYMFRPGGLTGVFNTGFSGAEAGEVDIYGYGINFSRFSFRQTLNRLSPETFIDGELTLHGPVGGESGMRVGFTRLALSCNGNLGNGRVDTEPDPAWPDGAGTAGCDGISNDPLEDDLQDEGCFSLDYWNMPILLSGMTFANNPQDTASGECNSQPRVLKMDTRTKVDKLGSLLSMSSFYYPDGGIGVDNIAASADTWMDKPTGEGNEPGFSFHLADAYLNELVDPDPSPGWQEPLPPWQGFMVVSGHIDVPLFNDAKVKGHLLNLPPETTSQAVFVYEDGEDNDRDGIAAGPGLDSDDEDALAGSVTDFREMLTDPDVLASPKTEFRYFWPREGIIDLSYRAAYTPATDTKMPRFLGIADERDLAGVLNISSVPDYITPKRTKFSFGVSADTAALANLTIDVNSLTEGLNTFLLDELGVDLDLEAMLADLVAAEKFMHDISGGDVSDLLSVAIDEGLNRTPVQESIRAVAHALQLAHQGPYMLQSILMEPFLNVKEELYQLVNDPDLNLAALTVTVGGEVGFDQALAPFLRYDAEILRPYYEAVYPAPGAFDALKDQADDLQLALDRVLSRLDDVEGAKEQLEAFITEASGDLATGMDQLITLGHDASALTETLYQDVTQGLGNYANASSSNELLTALEDAKTGLDDVRRAIASVHLGDIADALYIASLIGGSPLDVSMLHAAEDTANNAVLELETLIQETEARITDLLESLPLADILAVIDDFIGDVGLIQQSLNGTDESRGLIGSLEDIRDAIPEKIALLTMDLDRIHDMLNGFRSKVDGGDYILQADATWASLVTDVQAELDSAVGTMVLEMSQAGAEAQAWLWLELSQLELQEYTVATLLADQEAFKRILTAPLNALLEDSVLQTSMADITDNVTAILPNPDEEEIRQLIRSAILNTEEVRAINDAFFSQMGVVSDLVDEVSGRLTQQINVLIRETIASVNEELQKTLDEMTDPFGPDGWNIGSAGLDGYAIVSQDEVEKIHLEAEFTFGADPDPTSYNAALDITSWNTENGGSSDCTAGGVGNVDVVLSTHDVSAAMLGMDVGIKKALFGIALDGLVPEGGFGYLYLMGELGFESMVLYDLGFETAFGSAELYFAATGAARFSDYSINKAAFYLGRSCLQNNVLGRLDPEVGEFVGEINPFTGVYVRGAAEVPIWNNGCALTLAVGADIGAWYFTEPGSGTFGGLMGGSAYGELGCLASLKGALKMIGQKSGSEYSFSGSGWGAAGVGYCSPKKWKGVRDARKDDWCLTGEATFGVTYQNGWEYDGPDISCCH